MPDLRMYFRYSAAAGIQIYLTTGKASAQPNQGITNVLRHLLTLKKLPDACSNSFILHRLECVDAFPIITHCLIYLVLSSGCPVD